MSACYKHMKKHDKNETEMQQEPVKQVVEEQKDQIFIISHHQGREANIIIL